MLELLIAAVQESGDGGYSTEQILLVVLPIVVVAGAVLFLRKRAAG